MLPILETGASGSPAIVFLHGAGLGGSSWTPVIERLGEFHCLAPDLPEQGRNRATPFSLDGSARAVIELIRDRVPGGRAHLVGLSLGGAIAQTVLRIAPEVVDHAVITGSSDRLPGWLVRTSRPLLGLTRFVKPETMVRATIRQQRIPPRYHDLVFADMVIGAAPAFLVRVFDELTRFEPPTTLDRPLLVCVGGKEPGGSRWYGRISLRALGRYRSAKGVAIPGGGHLWPLEFPDLAADLIRAWLSDQPLPTAAIPVSRRA